MSKKYYKADSSQRRPWAPYVGMLGAFALPEFIRHAMSAPDRQICLTDLLSGAAPPQNGTERGARLAALPAETDAGYATRKSLLTLAAAAESEAAVAAYLGLTEIPVEEVADFCAFVEEENDPARVDDASRPVATKAAHVRRLFTPPPAAPFGATLGDAAATKGGKRSKR